MRTRTQKQIAKRSNKRAKQEREYAKVRDQYLNDHPICEVHREPVGEIGGMLYYCQASEVHHKRGRIGKYLTDTRYFLAVCREAHDKIENNPSWAREKGYSESRLTKEI